MAKPCADHPRLAGKVAPVTGGSRGPGGEPGEIVGATLYLASDGSTFTTGSILRVDGGMAVTR